MALVRKHYKRGTTEPRQFVIPEDRLEAKLFAALPLVTDLDTKEFKSEMWPVKSFRIGQPILACAYRFLPEVDAERTKEALMEYIKHNMVHIIGLAQENFTNIEQDAEEKITYKFPYDSDAW